MDHAVGLRDAPGGAAIRSRRPAVDQNEYLARKKIWCPPFSGAPNFE